ncbi:MAG TPA: DMT family transporter, partial [Acidimicrobiales bacterium]|nr:DMT family transporter [Acidimicrobiales bacterium]
VFARTLPAALLLAPVVVARRQVGVILANLGWIAVFAVVEFGIPWYLMSTAERHIDSSLTSLVVCAVPVVSVALARLRRTEEPIARRRLAGLGVGAVGVALLVGLSVHGGSAVWVLMMLLVVVGYSVGPRILAGPLSEVPGVAVVAGGTLLVALGWLPWSVAHWPARVGAETVAAVATLAVVCTAGAFLVFFELVKEAGPTRSVVVTYLNTALAVALGVVFLNEPLTASILAGFPLVLVGSVLATAPTARATSLTFDPA